MKKYFVMLVATITLFSLLLISCTDIEVGYVGSNTGNQINGTYKYFDGVKSKVINAEAGNTIDISYSSEVNKGELSLKVLDSSHKTIAELEPNTTGTKEIKVSQDEKYELIIKGSGTEGNFKVEWEIN